MKYPLFFLVLFLMHPAMAQSNEEDAERRILFTLVDSLSDERLPFATVYVKELNTGKVANAEGEFYLAFLKGQQLSVEVRFLGYRPYQASYWADDLEKNHIVIRLQPSVTDLGEYTVSTEEEQISAEEIVNKAITDISQNFDLSPYLLNTYYRQTRLHKKENTYDAFVQAEVGIFHEGGLKLPEKLSINQVRRSIDYRTDYIDRDMLENMLLDMTYYRNGIKGRRLWKMNRQEVKAHISTLNNIDRIDKDSLVMEYERLVNPLSRFLLETRIFDYETRKHLFSGRGSSSLNTKSITSLRHDFVKKNKLILDSILVTGDDLIYKVKFLAKSSKSYEEHLPVNSNWVPVGFVFVRDSDFAITKFTVQLVAKNKVVRAKAPFPWLYKADVEFREIRGKFYPSYIRTAYVVRNKVSIFSPDPEDIAIIERELLITQVIKDTQKIEALKSQWNWNQDLYDAQHVYDAAFWNSHNFIKETKLQEKLRNDLERKMPLEQQFKRNK